MILLPQGGVVDLRMVWQLHQEHLTERYDHLTRVQFEVKESLLPLLRNP